MPYTNDYKREKRVLRAMLDVIEIGGYKNMLLNQVFEEELSWMEHEDQDVQDLIKEYKALNTLGNIE